MWLNTIKNRIFEWTGRYEWLIKNALMAVGLPFIAARVLWFGEVSPAVLPLLLVLSMRGENIYLLFAGAALGALSKGFSPHAWMDGCAALILCALCFLIRRMRWPRWTSFAAFILSALAPVVFFAFHTPGELAMRAVQLLLSLLLAVVMFRADRAFSSLPGPLTEEGKTFLLIALCLLVTGLGGLNVGPASLMRICAVVAALIAAHTGGAAAGAVLGLLLGAFVSLADTDEALLTINISVAALAAGALRPLPRPAMSAAFIIANAIATFMENSSAIVILPLIDSIAACIIFCLLPKSVFGRVKAAFIAERLAADPAGERADINIKAITEDKLRTYSNMFLSLSQAVARNLDVKDSEIGDTVLELVRARACEGCGLETSCWEHDFGHTRQTLAFCLSRSGARSEIRMTDVPPGFLRRCLRQEKLVSTLSDALCAFKMQKAGARSLGESRRLISDQLLSASQMLGELSGSLRFDLESDLRSSARLRRALEKAGFEVRGVQVENRGDISAHIALGRMDIRKSYGEISSIVSNTLARKMRALPAGHGPEGEALLTFAEFACAAPECGVAIHSKYAVSGDSTLIKALGHNKFVIALSDGMGQGPEAATESSAILSLTEHFMEAELPPELMISSLNRALRLGAPSETYATLDLAVFDMKRLCVSFLRMGAAVLYISSGGKLEEVSSPAPPAGIVDSVNAQVFERRLQWDDCIIMMTDGVSDRLGSDAAQLISVIVDNSPVPQDAADMILQAALSMEGPQDDMTVIVARAVPFDEGE